jgi:methyl-accepting chemotaxis protein
MKDMAVSYGTLLEKDLQNAKNKTMTADQDATLLKGVGVQDAKSSYAYLVNADGVMLYHPTADKIGKPVENSVVKGLVAGLKNGVVPEPDVITYLFDGEMKYASYYITPTNHEILVITANQTDILSPVANITRLSMLAALLAAIVAIIIGFISAKTITSPIRDLTGIIGRIAGLNFSKDGRLIILSQRGGEVGDMALAVENLSEEISKVVGEVTQQSSSLSAASTELDKSAEDTATSVEQVEKAVSEIAQGATSQAQETQKATENIIVIGNIVEETNQEVKKLMLNAQSMLETGRQADETLQELNRINEKAGSAIQVIYEQTNNTNTSAMKIKEVTTLITSIAEEINLLSLNASIEAARAGEQGRGFAVVASQIQKLADQSNTSATQIEEIISLLISDSAKAVQTMSEVKEIIATQNEHVGQTQNNFNSVKKGIDSSTAGIATISASVNKLDEARVAVVDVVQNLTAIAQENAASTEETSASVTQVSNIISGMADNAGKLEKIAVSLEEMMKQFQLGE